jgi:hypothetical protein
VSKTTYRRCILLVSVPWSHIVQGSCVEVAVRANDENRAEAIRTSGCPEHKQKSQRRVKGCLRDQGWPENGLGWSLLVRRWMRRDSLVQAFPWRRVCCLSRGF